MIKNLIIFACVCGFVLLKTYGDYLEQKVENLDRVAVVTPAQLGEVRHPDRRLNISGDTIASLCNTLSLQLPRGSKNSERTAKNCQCVIDTLPDYLHADRADEFKKVYKLRYVTYTKMDRTTNEWVKEDLFSKYEAKYQKMFDASGLTDREYGQGILAVTKHVQKKCELTSA